MMNWGGMMGGFGFLGMIFGLFFTILFTVGFVVLIVWAVKQFAPGEENSSSTKGRALEILQERFAKGEISKEEFREMKKELLE